MGHRQRKDLAAIRRRVEDEGDEEGGPDLGDLDDDSLSEGSILSEEDDPQEGDEISTAGAAPAASPELSKVNGTGEKRSKDAQGTSTNGTADASKKPLTNGTSDMDMMLNGLKISDQSTTVEEVQYEDLRADDEAQEPSPAVVNSTAQMDQPQELPHERRRREHEEYKKKRDADPAFVPNRGAFFMHDHRHSGPAANGFRPFGRGRGRGRPGIGGPFAPSKYVALYNLKIICLSVTVKWAMLSNLLMLRGRTTCTKSSANPALATSRPRTIQTELPISLHESLSVLQSLHLQTELCQQQSMLGMYKFDFSCPPWRSLSSFQASLGSNILDFPITAHLSAVISQSESLFLIILPDIYSLRWTGLSYSFHGR